MSSATTSLRPPAVPLVTIDPYFSVWSINDRLTDGYTRHWTVEQHSMEQRHGMVGLAVIDGRVFRFLGKVDYADEGYEEPEAMEQISLAVRPTSTLYTFTGGGVTLQVTFTSPLLMDRLDILSRPASYVTFEAASNDGAVHDVRIYFDATAEWCVHTPVQEVVWSRGALADQTQVMWMGTHKQPVLKRKGDSTRIDWGYFYVAVPQEGNFSTAIGSVERRKSFVASGEFAAADERSMPRAVEEQTPAMATLFELGEVGAKSVSRYVVLAYDDIFSVEYFHQQLPGYWRKQFATFEQMLEAAIGEYAPIMELTQKFDEQLMRDALAAGGEKYRDVLSLAYRQAIAAHKLVEDGEGNLLFMSKECNSNGCMATVDVSYPSIPLFLLYNPELVKGMMRPIYRYASSPEWPYDFAPHDVGRYPIANGQAYGMSLERQMPIEECGNMLVMAAAVALAEGNADFAKENWELLTTWVNYLRDNGLDPGNQLCTDDFAGHLAHNANLSVKAIVGIGSYAILCGMLGKEDEKAQLLELARGMAVQWEELARDGDHYKLAFDKPGTWSLKYNLIWDRLFGLHLFADEIFEKELSFYLAMQNQYGTPLDNRSTYTKSDWLVWAAALSDDRETFERLIAPLWHFANESRSRVPFSDWYYTLDAKSVAFKNRTVVGGLFIQLLKSLPWKNA
ncbi:glutaminase family protein [Paenibacillus thalictri]|uniref:glutaminase family protein n=1 Tax=Paenibacillus thalictri TaxID=2527873 RepID=UPI001F0D0A4C|nr:glutaminase family protein [Paenibacillus thalictri]